MAAKKYIVNGRIFETDTTEKKAIVSGRIVQTEADAVVGGNNSRVIERYYKQLMAS